jgi:exodeoxyribonuclease VII small subunit
MTMGAEMTRNRSFEAALAELEDRVRKLDAGDLPLEEALRLFEEGVALQQECQDLLEATEQRILELVDGPGGPTERDHSGGRG